MRIFEGWRGVSYAHLRRLRQEKEHYRNRNHIYELWGDLSQIIRFDPHMFLSLIHI